jgi:hypothetical protein
MYVTHDSFSINLQKYHFKPIKNISLSQKSNSILVPVYFCISKIFLKQFKFFLFFSLLQINIF